jgi:hypothetical protein
LAFRDAGGVRRRRIAKQRGTRKDIAIHEGRTIAIFSVREIGQLGWRHDRGRVIDLDGLRWHGSRKPERRVDFSERRRRETAPSDRSFSDDFGA